MAKLRPRIKKKARSSYAFLQKEVKRLHERIGFLDSIIRQLEKDKEFYRVQIPHALALKAIFEQHARG